MDPDLRNALLLLGLIFCGFFAAVTIYVIVDTGLRFRTYGDIGAAALYLVSLGIVDKPTLAFQSDADGNSILETRPVWFGGEWTDCPIHDRARMKSGSTIEGPAIIEEAGGTSVVPPGWKITVHASGALICRNPLTG